MKQLIKNAQVVLPNEVANVDVIIEGEKIAAIDPAIQSTVDQVIDASGLTLLPGVIDDQVHFREPGLTHKEDLHHASMACARGGITTFLEMPNTIPNAINQELIDQKLELGAQNSLVNYGFYIGATPSNAAELSQAKNVPGIKIFIGSSTGDLLVDQQEALERIFAETTLPICAHCEDESTIRMNSEQYQGSTDLADHSRVRDHEAAIVATRRAIKLAHKHNHRFHVLHVSTGAEIEVLADHRNVITAEVCPHHLFFNVDDYATLGSRVKMNPSIKNRSDNEQLFQALVDNTIQVIATDHAPHTLEEKSQPYPACPSGLPAVENSLALMLDQVNQGNISLRRVVDSMCDAPARVWDIINKGRIEVGYDADLVLVDMNRQLEISDEKQLTKCRWSPWNGKSLKGWPVATFVMGRKIFEMTDQETFSFDQSKMGKAAQYDHALGGYWSTS